MRYLSKEIERFLREEQKMALIAGPRQVGKTTLAEHLLSRAAPGALYFNWDIESHRKAIIRNPEEFWQSELPVSFKGRPRLALDEIHKYPRWKRFLKGLYDARGKELEIIVTGSGRLDLYQKGGDSLFGRYHLYHLHPFTLGEFLQAERETVIAPDDFWNMLIEGKTLQGSDDGLKTIEKLTGFPEPLFSGSEARLRRWRRSHRTLVIREDLRDLTRIREIGLVETLLELLPERIGSPLSVNSLRQDLGVNFLTVRGWIDVLKRLYFLFSLKPYAGRLARTLRKEEKAYLFDFSVIENPAARFENLVALHLYKLCDAWTDWGYGDFDMYYVRDREKREVDFLITKNTKPYALIEAKLSAEVIDPNLKYFKERFNPEHTMQIVREPKNRKKTFRADGILAMPAAQFLSLI